MLAVACAVALFKSGEDADQAVQPQTREHLDVCALLGIPRGVVALTKTDLVDDELREVAELEVQECLEGTFLEGAPIVEDAAEEASDTSEEVPISDMPSLEPAEDTGELPAADDEMPSLDEDAAPAPEEGQ